MGGCCWTSLQFFKLCVFQFNQVFCTRFRDLQVAPVKQQYTSCTSLCLLKQRAWPICLCFACSVCGFLYFHCLFVSFLCFLVRSFGFLCPWPLKHQPRPAPARPGARREARLAGRWRRCASPGARRWRRPSGAWSSAWRRRGRRSFFLPPPFFVCLFSPDKNPWVPITTQKEVPSKETPLPSLAAIGLDLEDFNFLVEIKLCFPLNPQKVLNFLQGGQQQIQNGRGSKC